MGRVSRRQALANRATVVEASSRLFRERGIDGVSVPELMGTAGLTHGGFYRQFDSKDALAALACTAAFDGLFDDLLPHEASPGDLAAFLATYLSPTHRDSPADGCPATAFAADVTRAPAGSPVRAAYAEGVRRFVEAVEGLTAAEGDEADATAARQRALVTLATLVGTLTLARATAGEPIADELLSATRAALGADGPAADAAAR
ncbi:MAG TPA: TetR/AcrR family transcriptional regulator [Conexibacter sp.]|jgi:TetR/AcrR family transcriptional repressor of nem operon